MELSVVSSLKPIIVLLFTPSFRVHDKPARIEFYVWVKKLIKHRMGVRFGNLELMSSE